MGAVAATVLLASLLIAWYAVEAQGGTTGFTVTGSDTFFLGQTVIQTAGCSGSSACPVATSNSSTYTDLGLHNTGNLYQVVQFVVIAGIALAIAGTAILFGWGETSQSKRSWGITLLFLATGLAIIGPIAVLAYQPTAIHNDSPSSTWGSVASSFSGACSGSACGTGSAGAVTASWGPSLGWYLPLVAAGILIAGMGLASFSRIPSPPSSEVGGTSRQPPSAAPASSAELIACRNCGRVYALGQHRYCPNCGARMEGPGPNEPTVT